MLWESRFFLVDWVNGGMSDPYFDLATFSIFHGLNEERLMLFLTHYLGRTPHHIEWNRLIVAQPIRLFVIAASLFSSLTDTTTYEEIGDKPLPTLSDFGKQQAAWPAPLLGAAMFQAALTCMDHDRFQQAWLGLKRDPKLNKV